MKNRHFFPFRSSTVLPSILALTFLGFTSNLHAVDIYWDSNGTTTGAGTAPTGNWGTSSFWNTDSAGDAGTFSTSIATTDNAIFSAGTDATGTATITLNANTTVGGLTIEEGTVKFVSATTVKTLTVNSNVTLNKSTNFGTSTGTAVNLNLGTNTLTHTAGTLDNYGIATTGGTFLQGGNSFIGHANALGSGSVTIGNTAANSTYTMNPRSITFDRPIVLDSGDFTNTTTIQNTSFQTSTMKSDVTSVGTGARTLNINSVATSGSGKMIWNVGTINHTGVLNLQNTRNTGSGTNGTLTVGAVIGSNVTNVNVNNTAGTGTQTITISGANTYTGNTTVSSTAKLFFGASNVIPNGVGTGDLIMNGTLDLSISAADTTETINGLSGTGTITHTMAGTSTLTIGDNDATSTFDGIIQNPVGTVAITKIGTGTLTLTGANNYSGDTRVEAGTLILTQPMLNDVSTVEISSTGTLSLDFTGTNNIGTFTIDGVTQSGGTWGAVGSGADHQTSRITGTGILMVTPTEFVWTNTSGDEKWSTASNWDTNSTPTPSTLVHFPNTADTNILNDLPTGSSVGTLRFETDAPAYTIAGTNTLGISLGIENLSLSTQTLQFPIELLANANLSTESSLITLSGDISGSFGINKIGAGDVSISGINTYTGNTTINGGILNVLSADALPPSSIIAFTNTNNFAALDITGLNQTLGGMTFGTQTTGSNAINIYGDATTSLTLSPSTLTFAPLNTASNLAVDMSTLGDFTYNNPSGSINVNGGTAASGSSGHFTTVTLPSTTNNLTALNLNVGNAGSSNGVHTSTLTLGTTSSLNVDKIGIGSSGSRASGNLITGTGTCTVRGTDGSSPAALTIGVSDSYTVTDTTNSLFDASAGALDAQFSDVIIAKDGAGGSARGITVNATLKMGAGTMSAATMTLGNLAGAYTGAGSYKINGSLELNGPGTATITSLTFAQNAATTSPGTLAFNNQVTINGAATLNATTIQQGTITGVTTLTNKINWLNGTIGNISGGDLTISDVAIELAGADPHAFQVSSGQNATVSSVISSLSGSTPLTKAGAGTLTLTGANTYTGSTIVNAGMLEITSAFLDDASAVEIASGASLKLNFTGTDIVDSLTLDGVLQTAAPATTYGATGSGAMVIDDVHFSGTGVLQVGVIATPYDSWIAGFALTGADAEKTADPDGDGQINLLEFALDANPTSGASTGKFVSKIDSDHLTLTLPVRTGATFSGTAPMTSAAIDNITYSIEGDDDLSGFTSAVEEVTALTTGLPTLTTGWTYRTFRLTAPISSAPKGFLRAVITEIP